MVDDTDIPEVLPPGSIAKYLKAPFERFLIRIKPQIRWENFRAKGKHHSIALQPDSPIFKLLKDAAQPTKQVGTYELKKIGFKFMLYETTGNVVFYPTPPMENAARALLYFLTSPGSVGLGLTRGQALGFLANLELYNLEGESEIEADPWKILPDSTRIGVTIFDPVPYFGPATIEHYTDLSKEQEMGTRKSPPETNDVQEMIARPVRVEGWIRRIPPAVVALGDKVNELVSTYNSRAEMLLQTEQNHDANLQNNSHTIKVMNRDVEQTLLLAKKFFPDLMEQDRQAGFRSDIQNAAIRHEIKELNSGLGKKLDLLNDNVARLGDIAERELEEKEWFDQETIELEREKFEFEQNKGFWNKIRKWIKG